MTQSSDASQDSFLKKKSSIYFLSCFNIDFRHSLLYSLVFKP